MSLNDLVKLAHNAAPSEKSLVVRPLLTQMINASPKVTTVKFDDWVELHASQLYTVCVREFLLMREVAVGLKLPLVERRPKPEMQVTFDIGTAVHRFIQDGYFKKLRGIYGRFLCPACGSGEQGEDLWLMKCPACGWEKTRADKTGTRRYGEQRFSMMIKPAREDLASTNHVRLMGSMDGAIRLDPAESASPLVGIEIKTISRVEYLKVVGGNKPKPEHAYQVSIYGVLSGIKEWRIIYVPKEFMVPPAPALFEIPYMASGKLQTDALLKAQLIANYMNTDNLPPEEYDDTAFGCKLGSAKSKKCVFAPLCYNSDPRARYGMIDINDMEAFVDAKNHGA